MRTLAELTKRQRDKAFNQQQQDSGKTVIISTEPAGGGPGSVLNPAAPAWDNIQAKPTAFPPDAHAVISHSDVPTSYIGQAGKVLVVNASEDGMEFGASGGGGSAFFDYGLITSAAGSEFDQDWGGIT